MVRKEAECKIDYREHMRGGDGTVKLLSFINGNEELCGKGRLFSKTTLEPGCSIGYHVHETDSELFYFLSGTAVYTDGDVDKEVTAGDVAICPPGTGHGVKNNSSEPVEFVALIVYA